VSQNQWGWFLFITGLCIIIALLIGDVVTLVRSGGAMDSAFVTGMIAHVLPVLAAFKGGSMLTLSSDQVVSNQKRAELSNDKVGV